MLCDLKIAAIIADFAIGGITLRAAIALLKKLLKVEGPLASALAMACSFIATAIYLAVTGNLSPVCLVVIGLAVYAGTQATYSITKPQQRSPSEPL